MDHGTLQQLKDLINRRNVVAEVKKDVHACEDYFLLVVKCHVLVAAMKHFNMASLDNSCESINEPLVLQLSKDEKRDFLYSLTTKFVEEYVHLVMKSLTTHLSLIMYTNMPKMLLAWVFYIWN